ncbi:MAG: phosphatidate cytidylyltransferase [Firmicutes bacterium]|nr:phosphatidate cytidylyltransferase [Bacillota bacterium]
MSSLTQRVLTAVLGIPLLLFLLYWGGLPFILLVQAVGLAALYEYKMLWAARGLNFPDRLMYLSGLAIISTGLLPGSLLPMGILFLTAVISFVWQGISGTWNKSDNLLSVGLAILGLVYIAWPLSLLLPLRQESLSLVLFLLALAFGSDTAAYFVGINFGRRRLAPAISPKKSWEGAIGALVFTGLLGALWGFVVNPAFTWLEGFIFGVIASVFGQIGDLIESMLKRYCGVKDSGKILPGHGGILDRIDSLLLIIPVIYIAVGLWG